MPRSLSSLTKEELDLLDRLAKSFSHAAQRRAASTTRMHQAAMAHDFPGFEEARRQDAEAERECSECLTTLRVLKQLLDLEATVAPLPAAPPACSRLTPRRLPAARETTPPSLLHPNK
ncbi:MAG: hypothetical protein ACLGSH_08630 [Acidobacteriota bacterium]